MNQSPRRFDGTVLVDDLPAVIRDHLGLPPGEEVRVTVESTQERRARLKAVMDRIGSASEANGLTQEILDEIVDGR